MVYIEDRVELFDACETQEKLCDFENGLEEIAISEIKEKLPVIAEKFSIDPAYIKEVMERF